MKPNATCIAGFVITAVMGWNLSGGLSDHIGENPLEPPSVTRSSRPRQPHRPSGPAAEAARRMAGIRSVADPAERMRGTIDLADSLPASEFEAWLTNGWFDLREGPDFMLFATLLRDRWQREDPEGLALWCLKDGSRDPMEVFSRFAETEPLRAIEFFKNHRGTEYEFRTMVAMSREHPDIALQRLRELNDAGLLPLDDRYVEETFGILAAENRAGLESLFASLKGPLKSAADRALVTAGLKSDFTGELRKLWDRPNGYEAFISSGHLIEGAGEKYFNELANLPPSWEVPKEYIDPTNAEKWWNADLAGLGVAAHVELGVKKRAMEEMARDHPLEALKRMGEFHFPSQEGDEYGGRWRIIKNAIVGNPEQKDEILKMVDPEHQHIVHSALEEMASETVKNPSSDEIKTPEEWLEKVATIATSDRYGLMSRLRNWPQTAISVVGEKFQAMPDDEKLEVAKVLASGISTSETNPTLAGDAVPYLLANSPDQPPGSAPGEPPWLGAAVSYTANLAIDDPEAGCEWVASFPEGQAKLWSQLNLHSIWKNYDPQAADRWLESLPAETRLQLKDLGKKPKDR